MNKFINYLGKIREQKKLSKTDIYLSGFAILIFLTVLITLPLINAKNQNINKSNAATTPTHITPGTNTLNAITTAGDYVLDAGTHTINTTTVLPAGVNLTANPGATLVINNNAKLKLHSNTTLDGLAVTFSGGSFIVPQTTTTPGDTYQQNITIKNCAFSGGSGLAIDIGQGYNNYHRNIMIQNNTFDGEAIFMEVASMITITGNTFTNTAGMRPIEAAGGNITITNNTISGGITGIVFLFRHDLSAWMVPPQNNVIENNVISNITEEGISFDLYGDDAPSCSVREYDTVASAPGSSRVILSSVNWTNQTTYTGSYYEMSFITGALAGKHYLITTESGPTFTLSIPGSNYAQLRPGDGAVISTMASNNIIAHNVVWNAKDGIPLYGWGYDTQIYNNIVTAASPTGYAIEFEPLNGITGTNFFADSVTDLPRRAPSDGNTASYNNVPLGIVSTNRYITFDAALPVFTPVNNSITNTTTTDPLLVNSAGGDYRLTPSSPNIDAGTVVAGRSTDKLGNPIYGTPDIGAYEYQPPYVMGTDAVNATGNIRIYEDGKYRYTSAATGSALMDFSATPVGGSFPAFSPTASRSAWLDISSITWNTTGTYSKEWTAAGLSATTTLFNVGNLQPLHNYSISVDGAVQTTAQADSNGHISYTYSGGWSTHKFNIDPYSNSLSATINTSPAGSSVTVGTSFTVDVSVNGGGQAFNAAQATVAVSANLSITSLANPSSNACNFTYTQTPTTTNPSFAGAILSSSATSCTVYTLTLTPLSAGTGTITFTNGSVKAYSNNGEILSSVQNGSYTVTAPTPTPTPTNTPTPTPTNTPTPTPTPTNTPSPTPTNTPTPTPTNTPVPTPTSTPTPTPTPVIAAPIIDASVPSLTYQTSILLTGSKLSTVTSVYINGSAASSTYPTNTTWQAGVSLNIGGNLFTVYGKDSGGNQSASSSITINRHKLGDINGDNVVDLTDISLFATDWQKTTGLNYVLSNMNNDGIVDLTDFSIIAKQYGQ